MIDATAVGHDECRAHAPCSKDGRFSTYECEVCSTLWEAADTEQIDEHAVTAYNALLTWVVGFRKNSSGRSRPIYIYGNMMQSVRNSPL